MTIRTILQRLDNQTITVDQAEQLIQNHSKKNNDELVAGKILVEMMKEGLTPDQMLEVIKLAKQKFNAMKKKHL